MMESENDGRPDEYPETLSQQRFGQFAQNYVTSVPHAQGEDLVRLLALARPHADWEMLDVATGGGHTALKFAPFVASVTVSDITPAMLEVAEKHLRRKGVSNAVFKQSAAEELPIWRRQS